MWSYHKPGFEALLLGELQKQQQCSQFCDTLLKAEGVSVPAHSCVLSAISPHISSALASTPPPPPGQSRLLEFQALGACTLLHMARLLYSGEMAGEGEKEKQDAVLAAAKLGIHGLVEVTKRDCKSRNEDGGGKRTDVAVQTESLTPGENEARRGRWRREVRNGSTVLWKETLSHGENDLSLHTEELQVNTAPPNYPIATLETIDTTALQSLGQTDSHLVPVQIPYVPISLVYPPNENEMPPPSSAAVASMQVPTTAEHTSVAVVAPPYSSCLPSVLPFSTQAPQCGADLQSGWTGPQEAGRDVVAVEWEDEQIQQFQGNIPGFISYFLHPDKGEGSRRRRRAGARGARRAGTSERRVRRPRVRTVTGRGGLTQMVDVQNVGVSRLQKLFLQRGGRRASRPGQGGGAVGRKLYLKTRELLAPGKSCQRGRRRGKMWDFSQNTDVLPLSEGGGGGDGQSGEKNTVQQYNQDVPPVGRARGARAKPASFSNVDILPAPSARLQPSPCPVLYSPAPSCVSPASSLLHTTSLPPPAPPTHEDQPEHIDRLLEEVMMGLDILANASATPDSQLLLPVSSSGCTNASPGNNLTQKKQQGQSAALQEACPGFHVPTQDATVTNGHSGSSTASSEGPILQLQAEGELNEILDNFLHSFEQHVDRCSAREEMGGESSTKASQPFIVLSKYRKTQTITPNTPHLQTTGRPQRVRRSQTAALTSRSQKHNEASRKLTGGTSEEAQAMRQTRRQKSQHVFSLEKKKTSVSLSKPAPRIPPYRGNEQLRQIPVVKLERTDPLPLKVTVQRCSQSREVKNPAKTQIRSSSGNQTCDRMSDDNQPLWWGTKMYPIRSRLREIHVLDSFCDEQRPPACRPGRPKKKRQLPTLSDGEGSTSQIQPQPVESCVMEEELQRNQKRHEEELSLHLQAEAEGRGDKRRAESEEETDDAAVVKKVFSEQMVQPITKTCVQSSESADCVSVAAAVELEEVIDIETISVTSVDEKASRETTETLVNEAMESSSDEMIDVDGDSGGTVDLEEDIDRLSKAEKKNIQPRIAPALSHFVSTHLRSTNGFSLGSTGSWEDEDIDVTGGSSPLPDPVIISWTESSEGEPEQDIDVV